MDFRQVARDDWGVECRPRGCLDVLDDNRRVHGRGDFRLAILADQHGVVGDRYLADQHGVVGDRYLRSDGIGSGVIHG